MRALLVAALLVVGACKQADDDATAGGGRDGGAAGDQSKSMSPEEVGQGMQLCQGYVRRVCRCAETDTSLAEDCELAKSRPDGLAMTVKFLAGSEGPISTRERLEAEAGARKVIAACVRADASLDPKTCPR